MALVLKVEGLGVARGGVPVLRGVTFGLEPGQALVLAGPNGIGKTTLLRTLAGLQPPLEGRIAGEEVAYGGHFDGLKATLSVAENLAFWARIYGGGGIEAALSAMDLGALRDRLAQHLSAGQKRRLGLARLAVTGRRLWVLDEPTVSLDQASVARFVAMVRAHLAGGGAAVMATHIALGLDEARMLDLAPFRAREESQAAAGAFDAAEPFA